MPNTWRAADNDAGSAAASLGKLLPAVANMQPNNVDGALVVILHALFQIRRQLA